MAQSPVKAAGKMERPLPLNYPSTVLKKRSLNEIHEDESENVRN